MSDIKEFIGKTPVEIKGGKGDSSLIFHFNDGTDYLMYHDQECCESVYLEDVVGDLQDLIGLPILVATKDTPDNPPLEKDDGDYTWTFYHIRNNKATVTLRWYGSSNGYYATDVSIMMMRKEGN